MSLAEAVEKLDEEMADTELCLRCRWDREFSVRGFYSPYIGTHRTCAPTRQHTCIGIRAAVREVAMATRGCTEAEIKRHFLGDA